MVLDDRLDADDDDWEDVEDDEEEEEAEEGVAPPRPRRPPASQISPAQAPDISLNFHYYHFSRLRNFPRFLPVIFHRHGPQHFCPVAV